jgi:hypothetical protein
VDKAEFFLALYFAPSPGEFIVHPCEYFYHALSDSSISL